MPVESAQESKGSVVSILWLKDIACVSLIPNLLAHQIEVTSVKSLSCICSFLTTGTSKSSDIEHDADSFTFKLL